MIRKEWPYWVAWTRENRGVIRWLKIATFPYFILVCIYLSLRGGE